MVCNLILKSMAIHIKPRRWVSNLLYHIVKMLQLPISALDGTKKTPTVSVFWIEGD